MQDDMIVVYCITSLTWKNVWQEKSVTIIANFCENINL